MAFECTIPIRWHDLDAQGHINNGKFVDLMQEARVRFLLEGPMGHLLGNGIVIVSHQVEFLAQMSADTDVQVRLWTTDVKASRFTYVYELVQRGQVAARARSVCCLFDFEHQVPRRFSPDERAWFASWEQPTEKFRKLAKAEPGPNARVYPFPVRWSDIDSYGHVNNVRYFDYVAEARVDLHHRWHLDSLWMVVRQDVNYLVQIEHRLDNFEVHTAIAAIGRTSFTTVQDIVDPLNDNRVHARTMAVVVRGDLYTGRPIPLAEEQQAFLSQWLERE